MFYCGAYVDRASLFFCCVLLCGVDVPRNVLQIRFPLNGTYFSVTFSCFMQWVKDNLEHIQTWPFHDQESSPQFEPFSLSVTTSHLESEMQCPDSSLQLFSCSYTAYRFSFLSAFLFLHLCSLSNYFRSTLQQLSKGNTLWSSRGRKFAWKDKYLF